MIWVPVILSLQVSALATICALPIAIYVAFILARKKFWGHSVLNVLVHLPLVLPPVITGYLLLVIFGRQGVVGIMLYDFLGVTLAFRWTGAALASGIMGFPLMVRAIRLGFEAVDTGLEDAARTLGATNVGVFTRVTLPLIAPAIIAGSVLGFAKALGEFGATITFVAAIPGQTETIPSAIYAALQVPGQNETIVWLVCVSIALAMGALIASEWLARKMVT